MRYYFHFQYGAQEVRDDEGLELGSPYEARILTMKALAAMRIEEPAIAADLKGWTVNVCDESGAVLFSVVLNG